jgi:hypothetical protein
LTADLARSAPVAGRTYEKEVHNPLVVARPLSPHAEAREWTLIGDPEVGLVRRP